MPSIETVTILISDLVGSTGLEARVGAATAHDLRREYFEILREATDSAGGREVKNTGDGIMAVFESGAAAVSAGVSMQQRLEGRNRGADEQLTIRVGISLGDATVEDGDYFGMPSIEAARLCDRAAGGQILANELVKMIGGRGDHSFASLGLLELKGIPEPVSAYEVEWEALDALPDDVPLPARLQGVPPIAYAGRETERERMVALWEARKWRLAPGGARVRRARHREDAVRHAHRARAPRRGRHCPVWPL